MQTAFDFGAVADVERVRRRLVEAFGSVSTVLGPEPFDQLVLSLISSRTRDAVSARAFRRLVGRFSSWSEVGDAKLDEIEHAIAEVTWARDKAYRLRETVRMVRARHPDFDLGFLRNRTIGQALAWLEQLPGVGDKVASATLNFSALNRDAFVVDTHVLRVLKRIGIVGPRASSWRTAVAVTAAARGWDAGDFVELHVLLKRLGQIRCRPRHPSCDACPLRGDCLTAACLRTG